MKWCQTDNFAISFLNGIKALMVNVKFKCKSKLQTLIASTLAKFKSEIDLFTNDCNWQSNVERKGNMKYAIIENNINNLII